MQLFMFDPFNAGTVFMRQILNYKDGHALKEKNLSNSRRPIAQVMKQKELNKKFMMFLIEKTPVGSHGSYKNISGLNNHFLPITAI